MAQPSDRAGLYTRLSEVLGVDHAGTLMSYLPGDEPATRSDLQATESVLRAEIEAVESVLRGEISAVANRMDGFDQRMDRFEDRMEAFHHALLHQGRTYVIASVSSILTTGALVAGIVRMI